MIEVKQGHPTAPMGLTSPQARQRLCECGPNAVVDQAPPRWRVFLVKCWSPVPETLEAAILLQIGVGEYSEAAIVGALLLFNATLSSLDAPFGGP